MTSTVDGEWTLELSGGCPKFETWHQNPQFQIFPSVDGATYIFELRQQALATNLQNIGLWVMLADDVQSRKRHITSAETIDKTKFKVSEQRILEVKLPLRDGGLPYIVVCSTFDPGQLGRFTLKVTSAEDDRVRLAALQPTPGPDTSRPAFPTAPSLRQRSSSSSSTPGGALAAPLGGFNPPGAKRGATCGACAPTLSTASGGGAAASPPPSNEAVVEIEGQGLSKKLEAQLAQLVKAALEQCKRTGRPYEDAEFPPALTSISPAADWEPSSLVATWRRPAEIAESAVRTRRAPSPRHRSALAALLPYCVRLRLLPSPARPGAAPLQVVVGDGRRPSRPDCQRLVARGAQHRCGRLGRVRAGLRRHGERRERLLCGAVL